MIRRKFSQQQLAGASKGEKHLAAIFLALHPPDITLCNQPVGQANRTVVHNLQPLGQFAYGNTVAAGKTLNGQHGLMLLRREAGGLGCVFTEMQKLPQAVTKLGQRLVLRFSDSMLIVSHKLGL
jgi:hypothetical protein